MLEFCVVLESEVMVELSLDGHYRILAYYAVATVYHHETHTHKNRTNWAVMVSCPYSFCYT